MRRLLLLAAALLCLSVAPGALAADVQTETASAGDVVATFSHRDAGEGQWTDMKVSVTRGGVVAYSATPKIAGCEAPYCAPFSVLGDGSAIRVVDVTGDAEPEVIVDFWSGGAHCCDIAQILRWNGSVYRSTTRDFADFGYTLEPADGFPSAWVTTDARFAYAFASFADSGLPVKVYTYGKDGWSNQTLAHEDAIRADATRWKKAYMKRRDGRRALGFLAAWVADEYLLDRQSSADAFVARELRAGRLKSMQGWPAGKAFVKELKKDLKAWGYVVRRGYAL